MSDCKEVLISTSELGVGFSSVSSVPVADPASDSDPPYDIASVTVEILDKDLQNLELEVKEKEEEKEKEKEKEKGKEKEEEKSNEKDIENVDKIDGDNEGDSVVDEEEESRSFEYPQRPDQPDCPYYLRTGSCKFGLNCKFNHPPRRINQAGKEKELPERAGQPECKYYLRTGGCKFGKACRYNHPREKFVVEPPLDYNFLGLPIRPGAKECPFYMHTGSCKYATNCRFHHPEPTAMGGSDPFTGYLDGGSVPFGPSQQSVTSWSSPRTLNEAPTYFDASPPFVPVAFSPPQVVLPNPDWNEYQAPSYQPERNVHSTSNSISYPTKKADIPTQHQQQMLVDEFPERPGQPECSYFMKTGDCKFRSGCKYHHPKNQGPKSSLCSLSPIGLPLRPDQSVCTHYSRYGICKFGPSCKFNHPMNIDSSIPSMESRTDQSSNETLIEESR